MVKRNCPFSLTSRKKKKNKHHTVSVGKVESIIPSGKIIYAPTFLQDNLHQQGILSDEEKERILREQREAEERLARNHNSRRDAQMAALKQRMSNRKKKRVAELARKHEQEKMEVDIHL